MVQISNQKSRVIILKVMNQSYKSKVPDTGTHKSKGVQKFISMTCNIQLPTTSPTENNTVTFFYWGKKICDWSRLVGRHKNYHVLRLY